jgi:hypothetical protein
MGRNEDMYSREGLIASMEDVYLKQFIFLRNLSNAAVARFDDEGLAAVNAGVRDFGFWRGEFIRFRGQTMMEGTDALSLLRNWDGCDFAMAGLEGDVRVDGGPARATVTLPSVPGASYFEKQEAHEQLGLYWRLVFEGMADGFAHDAMSAVVPEVTDLRAPFSVTWICPDRPSREGSAEGVLEDVLDTPGRAVEVIRRSSMNNGALYFFVAREVLRRFDTAGEQAIREGVQGIGRERGLAHRERHLSQGKELNMKNLMEDWDGPLVSVWTWRGEPYLSESTWHSECAWCPYAAAWQEFGQEGLALGYLYDMEVHTTILQTYRPGAIIRWEKLKTRGDQVCQFRFVWPDLLKPGDPGYDPEAATRPHLPLVPAP